MLKEARLQSEALAETSVEDTTSLNWSSSVEMEVLVFSQSKDQYEASLTTTKETSVHSPIDSGVKIWKTGEPSSAILVRSDGLSVGAPAKSNVLDQALSPTV